MRRRRSLDWGLIGAILALIITLAVWGLTYRGWVTDCEAKGGHWHAISRSGICISPDGRILP